MTVTRTSSILALVLAALMVLIPVRTPGAQAQDSGQAQCESLEAHDSHPTACGRVRIQGLDGDVVQVFVPRDVTIPGGACSSSASSPSRFCHLGFGGDGAFMGVGIWDATRGADETDSVMLGHLEGPGAGHIREVLHASGIDVTLVDGTERVQLPAGVYNIVLMTDGGEMTADLTFPELPGAVELSPTRTATTHVQYLPPITPSAVAGQFRAAGTEFTTTSYSQGALFRTITGIPGAGLAGVCHYTGTVNADTAYLPGCPERINAEDTQSFDGPVIVPIGTFREDKLLTGQPATNSVGAWHTMAGASSGSTVLAVFERSLNR